MERWTPFTNTCSIGPRGANATTSMVKEHLSSAIFGWTSSMRYSEETYARQTGVVSQSMLACGDAKPLADSNEFSKNEALSLLCVT
jgi:hypothetical protein